MDTTKLTREEALRRWNASKETKRKMVEKLETLVRNSCPLIPQHYSLTLFISA